MSRSERLLFLVVLGAAAWVRLSELERPLFWVDEAESVVNALTIVDRGVPVDRYLGQPIFENTLVEPWPESPEYEFRDSSYSRKGLATYHGWLPLYAVAASLRLHGIEADVDDGSLRPKHDEREMERRTRAARLPSALFGLLFLVAAFGAAREMFGPATGWSVLIVASFVDYVVSIAREARYYSATIALGMTCCWLAWRIATRGRWRDWMLGALAFSLLFHTHVITFLVGGAALLGLMPVALKVSGAPARFAAFAGIVGLATAPWVFWSGFLEQSSVIPRAWPLLVLPEDMFRFPFERSSVLVLFGAGFGLLLLTKLLGDRAPRRMREAFGAHAAATCYVGSWLLLGWLAFLFLMPAVSHVFTRMSLPMLGPGLLLSASICASFARFASGRDTAVGATAAFAFFTFFCTDLRPMHSLRDEGLSRNVREAVNWLRNREFEPGTRFFATPNNHFILTAYSGLPVQNVAPVRASFLDRYEHPVVFFECVGLYLPPTNEMLRSAIDEAGLDPDSFVLDDLRAAVTRGATRRAKSRVYGRVEGVPAVLPEFLEPLVQELPAYTERELPRRRDPVRFCPTIFRGFPVRDWSDWWRIYFYRFVDPESRSGTKANYAARMANAVAEMLPGGWTVAVSRKPVAPP